MPILPTHPPARPRWNMMDLLRTRSSIGWIEQQEFVIQVEHMDHASHAILKARYQRGDLRLLDAAIHVPRPHCHDCRRMPDALAAVAGRRGSMRQAIVDATLEHRACGLLPDLLIESLQAAIQSSLHVDLTPELMVCPPERPAELRVILREHPRLLGSCIALSEANPDIANALQEIRDGVQGGALYARPFRREGLVYQRVKDFIARADPDLLSIRGRMIDTVHEFELSLEVDPANRTIRTVVGRSERYPQTTCPDAVEKLGPAVGQPLTREVIEHFARHYGRAGCNHLAMLLVDGATIAADVLGGGLERSPGDPCPVRDVLDRDPVASGTAPARD